MFGSIAGVVSEFVLGITDPLYYSDYPLPRNARRPLARLTILVVFGPINTLP
jgi:hypothetical protein